MSADFDPAARMAKISYEIREAIRAALPAPPEQFFTVMVPGKVLNLKEYMGGFDIDGNETTPVLPSKTELAQAMLCDDMPTYSTIQLGPTGRSVARSYGAALSKLVPAGTTVGVDTSGKKLSDSQLRYKKAMEWLTAEDPKTHQSRVETYTKKQYAYTKVVEEKTKAFNTALEEAKRNAVDPSNMENVRAIYDNWVNENARTYRNFVQAAYMDWVITGKKEEVEYYFSVVDQDSALARVEQSKEAMRAMVIQDSDGSVEYQKVRLTPSCWAAYAMKKAKSGTDGVRTVEWYTWEISRLQKMNALLRTLEDLPEKDTNSVPQSDTKVNESLKTVIKAFVEASDAYKNTEAKEDATPKEKQDALKTYTDAKTKMQEEMEKASNSEIQSLSKLSGNAEEKVRQQLRGTTGLAQRERIQNENLIATYISDRDALMTEKSKGKNGVAEALANSADIPKPAPDPASNQPKDKALDFFTPISLDISASSSEDKASSSASAMSFGASYSYGVWSPVSASVEGKHSNANSKAEHSMASNSCKISFECMRVDITRPWLRAELFYDADLTVPPGEFISPGVGRMRDLMEAKTGQSPADHTTEMSRYSTFPMYPTAFLLACNVVLEISGETTHVQSHFSSSSTSAKASVSYGPFKVSADYSHTESQASTKCEATSTGCRITMKSPQIIGWISQMLPALPRLTPEQQQAIIAKQEELKNAKLKDDINKMDAKKEDNKAKETEA
ncbi:hypothetical protein E1B28_012060 [Marasmius oreades]|uniref:Uncharacterized protein n=1 Tax=Marasmius oreades TaxID=181124 RepID=A0A9P7UN98_9AGAR|nr:uncharacterized protein E1B28_012060 [Marasmius oreades]KAG7088023.1 hypothetical protein E1B28_012060 [Marasmius oreades]